MDANILETDEATTTSRALGLSIVGLPDTITFIINELFLYTKKRIKVFR